MDLESSEPITQILRAHPVILAALCLSAGALIFGFISLSAPSDPNPSAVSQILPTSVYVDVEGEVANPGIKKLELSSNGEARVADAIEAAGGFLSTADATYIQKNINLAAVVQDGMKLYIPKTGSSDGSEVEVTDKTNVNKASISQLTELKGIGESRAQAIIDNRPYQNLDEFRKKSKVPEKTIDEISDDLTF